MEIVPLKQARRSHASREADEERSIARQNAEAAINNELLTRSRVEALELQFVRFTGRGFWGRLCWLLTGK